MKLYGRRLIREYIFLIAITALHLLSVMLQKANKKIKIHFVKVIIDMSAFISWQTYTLSDY
jgi:hypothetical protein